MFKALVEALPEGDVVNARSLACSYTLKIGACKDVSAQEAGYLLSGGNLYISSFDVRQVGLSGARARAHGPRRRPVSAPAQARTIDPKTKEPFENTFLSRRCA